MGEAPDDEAPASRADERDSLLAFEAEIGRALARDENLTVVLGLCCEAIVARLRTSFARVWVLDERGTTLELVASAGRYTHLDGPHAVVPVGQFKIGRIAARKTALVTNDVQHDPEVADHEWAAREGLTAFAGHPLLVGDTLVGVVATFSKRAFSDRELGALRAIGVAIGVGVARSRTAAKLHENEQWLAATLRCIGDAVIATDARGRVKFMNVVAERMTGFEQSETVGLYLDEVFAIFREGTLETVESPVEKVLRAGTVVGLANHTVLRRRNGEYVAIADSAAPIRDERGKLTGIVLVFRDVSSEREDERARDAAHLRSEFLATAALRISRRVDVATAFHDVATMVVPALADFCTVLTVDDDGALTRVATMPEGFMGVGGETPTTLAPSFGPMHPVHRVIASGESHVVVDFEEWVVENAPTPEYAQRLRRFGTRQIAHVPMVNQGKTVGVMGVGLAASGRVFDIATVQLLEALGQQAALVITNGRLLADAERQRQRAEEANVAKDQFLATVSHELRTPLNAMLGWARMLATSANDEALLKRGLATIERNARAQAQLIEDLLDISRIVAGKLRVRPEPVFVPTIVEAAIDSARPAAEAKRILLETAIDPAVGTVDVDPDRLQQIIWNFIANAVKFTSQGGRVRVSAAIVGDALEIRVDDDGKGIDEKFLPHVFESFRQAEPGSHKASGLGLGLAIVRHLVELHGGHVAATSAGAGKGSSFSATLPLRRARESGDVTAPVDRSGVARTSKTALADARILVVDDEEDAREMLAVVLRRAGAEVTVAGSAAEALARLRESEFTAMVSDLGMPVMDGYGLLKQIKALPGPAARMPVLALTAYARSEDRARALSAGFATHVAKPVDPTEIVLVLARALGRDTADAIE